jgi:sugar phosphate isomerase/epimerase
MAGTILRKNPVKLSIVLSTQQTQFQAATFSGSVEANLKKIAALGYQGAELAIRDPKLVDVEDLSRLLKQYHLAVPAVGTGQAWGEEGLSFSDPDEDIRRKAIDRIKSHIPLAQKFGAVIIIGLIRGKVKPGVGQDQAQHWMTAALDEICKEAAPYGVRLALEPINSAETSLINTVAQGLDLVHLLDAKNFGLLLDTYHMNIEEKDIQKSIEKCKGHIFHFHVADSNRWYPGAGQLDFAGILRTLYAGGYDGFVSGEFLPQPDLDFAAKQNVEYLTLLNL